ncbi:MAG: hypothetical protein HKP27_15675 [Myxococcales bacterium]|nr:hypothetical protein [Myxococcales bacterium]
MNKTPNSEDRWQRAGELSAYLEGDLPEARRAALESELENDHELRDQLTDMRALRVALREMPDPEVPIGLSTRVLARVRDGEANPGLLRSLRTRLAGSGFSSVATAACGFAAAAFLFGTDAGRGVLGAEGGAEQRAFVGSEQPFRPGPQLYIPGVDQIDGRSHANDRALVPAPRVSNSEPARQPSAPAGSATTAPAETALTAPDDQTFAAANSRAASEVRPNAEAGDRAEGPISIVDNLDFRACLLADPSGDPACDATYQRWVDLAGNDRAEFGRELERVPTPVRDLWLRQITAFAQRSGQNFSTENRVDTGPRSGLPAGALGFGPGAR